MTQRRLVGIVSFALLVLVAGIVWADTPEDPAAEAARIVDAAGGRGGLTVLVGCGDGRLALALAERTGGLVHALDTSAEEVERARAAVREAGRYGSVSADRWSGGPLPYADNLVNLLVCSDAEQLDPDEVLRVLVPEGTACIARDGQWTTTVKPRPADIDDWTHYLHDATGNPVSRDRGAGPLRRLQWVAGPRWARHHDHMASMTSLVSTGGRLFYIFDEGPTASIQLPSQWSLIARDAFNGALLWRRPIPLWNTRQWPLKSGPAHLTRRLVAVGERVYVTLGFDAPVTALDTTTGETRLTFAETERSGEILISDGLLLALVEPEGSRLNEWRRRDTFVWENTRRANADWAWAGALRQIVACDAASGARRWVHEAPVAPCSLAADGKRVIFYNGERVVCLDQADGKPLWQSEPLPAAMPVVTSTGPRTVLYGDVVLFAGNRGATVALAAADGRKLWEAEQYPSGHQSLRDLLVSGGLVWSGFIAGGADSGVFTGRDPLTGEVKNEFLPDVDTYWFHHRCYPMKATEEYLLASRTGIEMVDPAKQHWETHHWVRGGCIYGVLPCNGLVYAPMHSCGCYLESKLCGFNALAATPAPVPTPEDLSAEARLERGPAYGQTPETAIAESDWPTYRHDPARSGATAAGVDMALARTWTTRIGGRLSPPVVAGGKLYVSAIDQHTLHALDAASGRPLWAFSAGARIDSPPTVHGGLVLFGSTDGYVYGLRSDDGALAWRFRAAPLDRRTVAFDQLESLWPVHGSVLVHQGVVYATAGRSMYLDGGIRLVRLDAATGRLLGETVMDERDPESGENMQKHVAGLNMPVALSDILSFDGQFLYMRSQKIDLEGRRLEIPVASVTEQPAEGSHLFCQIGFLDDSWFHRSFWTFGRRVDGGYGGWFRAGRMVPAGRILAFDGERVYGYGRKPQYYVNSSVLEHQFFAAEKHVTPEAIARIQRAEGQINARSAQKAANASDWKLRAAFPREDLTAARYAWIVDQPAIQVRALVAAGDRLALAGHPDFIDERRALRLPDDPEVQTQLQRQAEAIEGRCGGLLWLADKAGGELAARYRLPSPPVFDGLAAAGGMLFVSTLDGQVLGLGKSGQPLEVEDPSSPVQVISDEPAEPDYLKAPEVDRSADFQRVLRCRVVESELGYRLRPAGKKGTCLALWKLPEPRGGTMVLRTRLRIPGEEGFLQNGFLVFGNGPGEEQLVQCGVRLKSQRASIHAGGLSEGKSLASEAFQAATGQTVDLEVRIDLAAGDVVFSAGETRVSAKLPAALESITHIGLGCDNAVVDFSPIEVE